MNELIYVGLPHHYQSRYRSSQLRKQSINCLETIPQIIKTASVCFKVGEEELMGESRIGEFVKIRSIVAYTIRSKYKNVSLKSLGVFFNRDHATIIHMIKRYNTLSKNDKEFQDMIYKFTTFRLGLL